MRVSIALASFNGSRYLSEQLASFVSQTRRPDQVVVSDDGSTDATMQIVAEFAPSAPFDVILVKNKRQAGFLGNFENALSLCDGDLIFLSDQDDVWYANKIDRMIGFMTEHGHHLAINDQLLVNSDLKPTGGTMLANTRSMGLPDSWFVSGCCTVITKDFRDVALPFPDGVKAHDSWLHQLASSWGCRGVLEEPLQLYRRHNSNASHAASLRPRKRVEVGVNFPDFERRALLWTLDRNLYRAMLHRSGEAAKRGILHQDRLPEVISRYEKVISTLSQRLNLIAKARPLRVVGISLLLIKDRKYGFKQAISDIFTPRHKP